MLTNYFVSAIRTGVPALVGWVVAWLIARGIDVPADTARWVVGALTFGALMVYYLAVRALETRWPSVGVLLGVPARPVYPDSGGGAPGIDVEEALRLADGGPGGEHRA